MMTSVTWYNQDEIRDELLKFAVIAAKYDGKWIFCRHKQRTTWEIPGGHRENGENILDTARRELYEETGSTEFEIKPVCVYGVTSEGQTKCGLLCFAEIKALGELPPEMEIGEIKLFDTLPKELTYPSIQPYLFEKVRNYMKSVNVQVNPYLEFMNSILLTSRYNELTIPYVGYGLMTTVENDYTNAIKQFLNEYQNEPVYKTIEDMIPNGFTFSRPVELMLSLGNSTDFTMQHELSPLCVQYCGGMEQILRLLSSLKDLESRIHFFEFLDTIKSFYSAIVQKTLDSLEQYPFVDLIEQEFGKSQNSYTYILSSLMVGNFGISFVDTKTDAADLFSVFSTDEFSLSPGILFHEFSHSFINPLTDKYFDLVEKYVPSYDKLQDYKLPDYQSGYGDFKECINEHFVRAMSIHLLKKINHTDLANVQLKNDLYSGYRLIEQILERYDYYDRNRTQYDSIEEFYPELLESFDTKYLKVTS